MSTILKSPKAAPNPCAPNFPTRLMLEATNICNNQCIFCQHHNMKRTPTLLDLVFAERILTRAYELGARECAFHGGSEPFLHARLHELVRMTKRIGYTNVYLTTNAQACSWKRMQEVLEAGLDSLKFSVNAGNKEDYKRIHGRDGFNKACEMARKVDDWRKQNNSPLIFYISAVTCPENAANMRGLEEAFGSFVDKIVPFPAAWLGEHTALSKADTVARFPKGAICDEMFTRLTVTSAGFVRVCCAGSDKYMLVGDANTTDILEIWNGELFMNLRRRMLAHDLPENTVCFNCMNGRAMPLKPLADCLKKPDSIGAFCGVGGAAVSGHGVLLYLQVRAFRSRLWPLIPELRAQGARHVLVLGDPGFPDNAHIAEEVRELGGCYVAIDWKRHGVAAFLSAVSAAFGVPVPDKLLPAPSRPDRIPLTVDSQQLATHMNRPECQRALAIWRMNLALAATVVDMIDARLFFADQDTALTDSSAWVLAVQRRSGVACVLGSLSQIDHPSLLEYPKMFPQRRVATALGRFVCEQFPHWAAKADGDTYLRIAAADALAMEVLGIAPPQPWIIDSGYLDKIYVESEATLRRILRVQPCMAEAPFVLAGSLIYDVLYDLQQSREQLRAEFAAEHGLDAAQPTMLVALSYTNSVLYPTAGFDTYEDAIMAILQAVRSFFVGNIILSLHPRTTDAQMQVLAKGPWVLTRDGSERMLHLCDCVVSMGSSVVSWALLMGLPVLDYYIYIKESGPHIFEGPYSQGLIVAETYNEFVVALKVLQKPGGWAELAEKSRNASGAWGMLDGQCAQRIVDDFEVLLRSRLALSSLETPKNATQEETGVMETRSLPALTQHWGFESLLRSQFVGPQSSAFHVFLGCQPPVPFARGRSLSLPELNEESLVTIRTLDPGLFSSGLTVVVDDAADDLPGTPLERILKSLAFVYCKYFFKPLTGATIPDIYGVRTQAGQQEPPLILHRTLSSLRNLPLHLTSPLADVLARHVAGLPVLVVLPGPSLHGSAAFLRAAASRCVVICVARTLSFCLESGIEPDFVVALDTDWRMTRLLNKGILTRTWLISLSNSNIGSVVHLFRGVFFMESFNTGVFRKKYRMRESWLSVSICCLGLAEALKASQVVLLGADGCWSGASKANRQYFTDTTESTQASKASPLEHVLPRCTDSNSHEGNLFRVVTVEGKPAFSNFLYYAINGELEHIACELTGQGTRFWQWGLEGILSPAIFTPLTETTSTELESWPLLDRAGLNAKLDAAHKSPLAIDVVALEASLRSMGQVADTCLASLLMQLQHGEDVSNHPVVRSINLLGEQQRFPLLPQPQSVAQAAVGSCMEWQHLQRRALAFMRMHVCRKTGIAVRLLYREASPAPLAKALAEAWPGLVVEPVRLYVAMLDTLPNVEEAESCAKPKCGELYSGIWCDTNPVLLSPAALCEAGDVPALLGQESWLAVAEVLRVGACASMTNCEIFTDCVKVQGNA